MTLSNLLATIKRVALDHDGNHVLNDEEVEQMFIPALLAREDCPSNEEELTEAHIIAYFHEFDPAYVHSLYLS